MKIKISYEREEKSTLINMMLRTTGVKEVTDNNEHYVGNFGEFKYDNEKNEIDIDLKPAFVIASAGLTATLVNIIKAFVSTCEMFTSHWLYDIKDLNKEESDNKDVVRE